MRNYGPLKGGLGLEGGREGPCHDPGVPSTDIFGNLYSNLSLKFECKYLEMWVGFVITRGSMNNKRPFLFFLISNLKRFYFRFSGKFFEKINKLIRFFCLQFHCFGVLESLKHSFHFVKEW